MKPEIKKLLILNLPYLLFVWLFDKAGAAVRLSPGADASAKLLHLGDGFTAAFSSIAPSFHPADLALGIAGAVIVRLIIYTKGKNAKKYRRGTEYGSARWGGADDIKPYTDPVFENNIPLTQTERLTMNSRPKQPKYARNKNILVIGGSGSGKTRFFVKPSLMQCTSKDFPTSYIVTDPKGTLILETGKMLQRYKYRIKVLNTINFKKSMKYNPFAYLRSEKDILKLVNTIIANTKGDGEKSGEDFWVKAEKLYYTALIGYIWYEAPEDEKNFTTLLEMINASEAREDDEDFQNPVDLMFERLEEKDPEHFAVKQYKKYKLAAGKTAKSILISRSFASVHVFAPFLSVPRVWDTSQQAIFNRRAAAREGKIRKWVPASYACYECFYPLGSYHLLRRKSDFAKLTQKKNAATSKKITTL
ncbi:VirD4-like conjugal transfer protein, CD1115 family, partial [Eggerthella sp. 1_3_56FAA]|uniref:VirD4-like conjugal transfer protein, CD1115 family n=1 Tax=Eggerthella sp. 1_3_56FAA TaxID=665943 RepID=UPI0018DD0130